MIAPQYRPDSGRRYRARFGAESPSNTLKSTVKPCCAYDRHFENHPVIDLIAVVSPGRPKRFRRPPSSKTRVFRVAGASCAETVQRRIRHCWRKVWAAEQDNIL